MTNTEALAPNALRLLGAVRDDKVHAVCALPNVLRKDDLLADLAVRGYVWVTMGFVRITPAGRAAACILDA